MLAHVFLSGEGADSRQLFTKFLWVRGTRSLPAATRPQPVHSRSSLTTPSTIDEEEACRFASRELRYSLPAFVELVTLKVKTRPSWNFSISFPDIATSFPWHYGPPPTRGVQSRHAAFGSFARHTVCLRRLFWYRYPLWDQLLLARVEFTILIPSLLSFLLSFVILRVCVAFSCGGGGLRVVWW